jgi:hypothetical protein
LLHYNREFCVRVRQQHERTDGTCVLEQQKKEKKHTHSRCHVPLNRSRCVVRDVAVNVTVVVDDAVGRQSRRRLALFYTSAGPGRQPRLVYVFLRTLPVAVAAAVAAVVVGAAVAVAVCNEAPQRLVRGKMRRNKELASVW